jgi:hypothetical protein
MIHARHQLWQFAFEALHLEPMGTGISDVFLVQDEGVSSFIERGHEEDKAANREYVTLYTAQLFVTQFYRCES